jgi:hypothetical protein
MAVLCETKLGMVNQTFHESYISIKSTSLKYKQLGCVSESGWAPHGVKNAF